MPSIESLPVYRKEEDGTLVQYHPITSPDAVIFDDGDNLTQKLSSLSGVRSGLHVSYNSVDDLLDVTELVNL